MKRRPPDIQRRACSENYLSGHALLAVYVFIVHSCAPGAEKPCYLSGGLKTHLINVANFLSNSSPLIF